MELYKDKIKKWYELTNKPLLTNEEEQELIYLDNLIYSEEIPSGIFISTLRDLQNA